MMWLYKKKIYISFFFCRYLYIHRTFFSEQTNKENCLLCADIALPVHFHDTQSTTHKFGEKCFILVLVNVHVVMFTTDIKEATSELKKEKKSSLIPYWLIRQCLSQRENIERENSPNTNKNWNAGFTKHLSFIDKTYATPFY